MQLNYFAAVRLTLALLPKMTEKGAGHVINISSIGVLTSAPRFSAYVASKAALEAWTRCAAAEYYERGVHFTVVNFPLVRTPMISPTKIYDQAQVLTPEQAAGMIAEAIVNRPTRVATGLGLFGQSVQATAPRLGLIVNNLLFQVFPETAAKKDGEARAPAHAGPDRVFNTVPRHSRLRANPAEEPAGAVPAVTGDVQSQKRQLKRQNVRRCHGRT